MQAIQEREKGQQNLNLKYLIAQEHQPAIPWQAALGLLVAGTIISILLWWGYWQQQEVIVIHEVMIADTLRSLAVHYYDNPGAWHKIFLANRKKLLHSSKNSGKLTVGEKLRIPLSQIQYTKWQKTIAKK